MGAGGCREPRKIKRNPGRGSQRLRRALGGTRILLAAAPTAPPCFCRWQRSSLLHWAVFAPSSATSPQLFESALESETLGLDKTKTSAYLCTLRFFGGRGWIRTTEAESSRFTVCPHWPLGNTPIFIFVHPFAGRLAYFSMGNGFCQLFFTFFFKAFLHLSKTGCGNVDSFVRKRRISVFFAAKIFAG